MRASLVWLVATATMLAGCASGPSLIVWKPIERTVAIEGFDANGPALFAYFNFRPADLAMQVSTVSGVQTSRPV